MKNNHRPYQTQPLTGGRGSLPRIAVCSALLGLSVLMSSAAIVADFNGGASTTDTDGYAGMGGNGWESGWTNAPEADYMYFFATNVISTTPLTNGGGNYLTWGVSNRTSETALRRKYTNTVDLDLTLPYYVDFDFRCDAFTNATLSPPTKAWNSGNDNFSLTARPGWNNNPGSDSTWWIKTAGAHQSGPPNARSNLWCFFDGGEFSSADSAGSFTNTPGFPFYVGTNYHFRVENRPYARKYVVSVSAVLFGTNASLTTPELRWRSYVNSAASLATNTTVLHFVARRDVAADVSVVSMDSIHISQAPLDMVTPIIAAVSPKPTQMQHPSANGMTFTVKTLGSTNWIPDANISMTLNGVDVTSSLNVSGTAREKTVTYSGLADNTLYTAVITASDQAGRVSTYTWKFDTIVYGGGAQYLEAENYNFSTNGASCGVTGSGTLGSSAGGYLQDPLPSFSDISGNYINQTDGSGNMIGYVDSVGTPGVDFFEFGTTSGNLATNRFRFCDVVGTVSTTDPQRPTNLLYTLPSLPGGVPECALAYVKTNEWWNYTHQFPNSKYLVYLRCSGSSASQFQLSTLTSDRTQSNQTTRLLGTFKVAATASSDVFDYTPLVDGLGVPRLVGLSGEQTLKLTALTGTGAQTPFVNLMLFVPQGSAGDPPWLSQVSPGANATNVAPQTDVNITLQKGSAPIDTSTIVLKVNGVDVTSSITATVTATGATVSYTPATFFEMGSWNTLQVVFGDGNPANLTTNQWGFHVGRYLPGTPVRVNFQPAPPVFAGPSTNPVPPGYLFDYGYVFGDRTNGYSYGWDQDVTGSARDRGTAGNPPDDRYRTLNQFGTGSTTRYWEIQLPNGTYSVRIVSGDGSALDSTNYVSAEGVLVISNGIPSAGTQLTNHWFDGTKSVTLADGRLTVAAATGFNVATPGAGNSKVCFIDITPSDPPLDLRIKDAAVSGGVLNFNIATIQRAKHIIEYKDSLAGNWNVLTNIVGTGSSCGVTDPTPASGTRFYRMRIP